MSGKNKVGIISELDPNKTLRIKDIRVENFFKIFAIIFKNSSKINKKT